MIRNLLSISLMLAAALAAPAPAAAETLRYNQWVPRSHHSQTEMMYPYFERIAQATEGRVRIEPTAASLGAPAAQYDMVRDGVADVIFGLHGYTPARFTLALIGLLPFFGDTAESVSVAYWRVSEAMFAAHDEYRDIKLLALMTSDPGHVFNNKRPIRSVEDFRGLKLRVSNTMTSAISAAFGVVPVTAPAPKTYELLANGVADGSYSTLDAYESWKLEKLLPYHTRFPGGLFFNTFFIAMNKQKWDAMSASDRDAVAKVSGEAFAIAAGRQWDKAADAGAALMAATKTDIVVAEGAFLADVHRQLRHLEQKWVEDATAKGVDGEKALAYMRAQSAAYERATK